MKFLLAYIRKMKNFAEFEKSPIDKTVLLIGGVVDTKRLNVSIKKVQVIQQANIK